MRFMKETILDQFYDTRKNSPSKEDLENAYKENNKENLIKIFLKKVFEIFIHSTTSMLL